MKNQFCDFSSKDKISKWSMVDLSLWYKLPSNDPLESVLIGDTRLWDYKRAYVIYNRDIIISAVFKERIPVLLLAGVVLTEVGGTPEYFKRYGVLPAYKLFDLITMDGNKTGNATSVGSVAMQLRAAAETLGIDPDTLTTTQQLQLADCLLNDEFNINTAAKHLKELILYDNPNLTDTEVLTKEQFIIAAARYNRGLAGKREDFIRSMNADIGDPIREWSSYGRNILKREYSTYQLLGFYR